MKRLALPLLVFLSVIAAAAAPPAWWNESLTQILDPVVPENNAGPLNLGQLKHVATQAKIHLDVELAGQGGAGPAVDALVTSLLNDPATNGSPANLGQVKAIAKPFYNRLLAAGYDTRQNLIARGYPGAWTSSYPWDPSTPSSQNFSPTLNGQLKMVFSFDLALDADEDGTRDWTTGVIDTDKDGMVDSWETANGFNPMIFDAFYSQDSDGDGFTDGYELWAGTDPHNAGSKPPSGTPIGGEELPVLLDDEGYVMAGYTVAIEALANDEFPDDSFVITSLTVPNSALGTASSDGFRVFFHANPGLTGDATFTYTVANPAGVTASAQVTVHINGSNTSPVTNADSVTVAIGSAVNIDVLANDVDYTGYGYEQDVLTVSLDSSPGDDPVVVQDDGIIQYRPSQETPGIVTFTYRATDPYGGSSTAVVTVNIVESLPTTPEELAAAHARAAEVCAPPAGATSATFYVSYSSGTDTNSGATMDSGANGPLKTIVQAKVNAAAFLNSAGPQAAAIVKLMPGKHPLLPAPSQPLEPGLKIRTADVPAGKTMTFAVAENTNPQYPAIVTGAMEFWHGNGGTWTNDTDPNFQGRKKFTFDTAAGSLGMQLLDRVRALRAARNAAHAAHAAATGQAAPPPDKSPTFTQMFVEKRRSNGTVRVSRKTRARFPDAGSAFETDTSRFFYEIPNDPGVNQTPVVQQWPLVRVPGSFTNYPTRFNGNTEIVFTRVWQNPRGIIAPNSKPLLDTTGYTSFEIPAMKNNLLDNDTRFEYQEGTLAEVAAISSLDHDMGSPQGNGLYHADKAEKWNRGWLENNLQFLNAKGEWYLDDTDANEDGIVDNLTLYYKPEDGEDVLSPDFKFEIPVAFTMISVEGDAGTENLEEQPLSGVRFIGSATQNIRPAGRQLSSAGAKVHSADLMLKFRYSAWQYENGRINADGSRKHDFSSFVHSAYGLSGLIDGKFIDSLEIRDCEISHYGASGIVLGGNRSRIQGELDANKYYAQPRGRVIHTIIENNLIKDGGGSAIRIDDFPKLRREGGAFRLLPGSGLNQQFDDNKIEKNAVHSIGRIFGESPGINVPHGVNTLVSRNHIHNVPNSGILLGWHCPRSPEERNVIEKNKVSGSMRRMADCAALYTFGLQNTRIRENLTAGTGSGRGPEAVRREPGKTPVETTLIFDIYLDNVSTAAVVRNNFSSSGPLELFYNPDMVGKNPPSRKSHNFNGQSGTRKASTLLNANRCPRGKEDPATCGCGAERLEAEGPGVAVGTSNGSIVLLAHNDASPSGSPGNPPPNYVKFTPGSSGSAVTFTLPNPQAGSSAGNVWYNLKIGMIRGSNFGKYKIKFNGKEQNEYPGKTPFMVNEDVPKRGDTLNIAERLTQHQVLWKINATDGPNVAITFISKDGSPITFDYFEFYRSAE